jgi:hypothetical protein
MSEHEFHRSLLVSNLSILHSCKFVSIRGFIASFPAGLRLSASVRELASTATFILTHCALMPNQLTEANTNGRRRMLMRAYWPPASLRSTPHIPSGHKPSPICNLRSAICDLQFAICNLRSAICDANWSSGSAKGERLASEAACRQSPRPKNSPSRKFFICVTGFVTSVTRFVTPYRVKE